MRRSMQGFWLALLVCAALACLAMPGAAEGLPFHEDYDAIDVAARSVLRLVMLDENGEMLGSGSGFVAFDNRTLVTNFHVAEGAHTIIGSTDAGEEYLITYYYAADATQDVAILGFMSPTDLTPLTLAPPEAELKRGEPVVAIGSPLGIQNTVSIGNVSNVRVLVEGTEMIQFTAPISHGSSGGAVFDAQGRVIGLSTGNYEGGQNVNFAVPVAQVLALREDPASAARKPLNELATKIQTAHGTSENAYQTYQGRYFSTVYPEGWTLEFDEWEGRIEKVVRVIHPEEKIWITMASTLAYVENIRDAYDETLNEKVLAEIFPWLEDLVVVDLGSFWRYGGREYLRIAVSGIAYSALVDGKHLTIEDYYCVQGSVYYNVTFRFLDEVEEAERGVLVAEILSAYKLLE